MLFSHHPNVHSLSAIFFLYFFTSLALFNDFYINQIYKQIQSFIYPNSQIFCNKYFKSTFFLISTSFLPLIHINIQKKSRIFLHSLCQILLWLIVVKKITFFSFFAYIDSATRVTNNNNNNKHLRMKNCFLLYYFVILLY